MRIPSQKFDSDLLYLERSVTSAAGALPDLDAGFPELVLQALLELIGASQHTCEDVARFGVSIVTRFLSHPSASVQVLASELLRAVSDPGGEGGEERKALCIKNLGALPPTLLLHLINNKPDLSGLAEAGLQMAGPRQLKEFWSAGCIDYLVAKIENSLIDAPKGASVCAAIEVLVRALEIESNQGPYVGQHGTKLLLLLLVTGPEPRRRALACKGLRAVLQYLSLADRTRVIRSMLSDNCKLVQDLPLMPMPDQMVVLEVLAECSSSSDDAKKIVLASKCMGVLVRVGLAGDLVLKVLCVRCMSEVWGHCSNCIGQWLHDNNAIPCLVSVVSDDRSDEATVTTAEEALWLAMEQSLECRTDFRYTKTVDLFSLYIRSILTLLRT